MKPILFLVVLLITGHASAQKKHPYLFYTNDRIGVLKEKIKADTAMNNSWLQMLARADAALASGKGGDMEQLALVYRMTGNKKYATQAKTLLENLLRKEYWEMLDDREPKWNAALATAHNNFIAAAVYDAIYDILTPPERQHMTDNIIRLGINPSLGDWIWPAKRLHTLNSMGHNWWSSIVFEAGVASLAIMTEKPEAKQWAEQAMDASREWFTFAGSLLENKPSSFDPAGGFYESINYANFGIGEYLYFRLAWHGAFNKIAMPYDSLLQKSMDWFMQMSYPNKGLLLSANFGDSGPNANADRPIKLMKALGFTNNNYDWYLSQTKRGRLREDLNINQPIGLLLSPVIAEQQQLPTLATSAIYDNMGWASLRSSWKENATLFAIKSGYTWNHAHADAGSFILYHNGKNLLIDGGNCWYANPAYSSYYVRSEAHNVLLFNGKAQEPQDQYYAVKNSGSLHHLMDAGSFKYILADATGPTSRYFLRNYRNVVWIGNVILIIDDVKSYEPGKFEWLLHTATDARKKGIDLEVTDSNASVLVRPLFPETLPNGFPHDFPDRMKWEERTGFKDHAPDVKQTYYSIFPPETSKQTRFVNAIILLDDKNKPLESSGSNMASPKELRTGLPRIERIETLNYTGVRVTQDGVTTDLYFNQQADGHIMHRNSLNTIAGWETDAYLLGLSYKEGADFTKAENINRWFVANGSFVRRGGQMVLSSLSKLFMVADISGTGGKVLLQGQPEINLHLNTGRKVSEWLLNGKAVPASANKNGDIYLTVKSK